jgi:hypothetical protein
MIAPECYFPRLIRRQDSPASRTCRREALVTVLDGGCLLIAPVWRTRPDNIGREKIDPAGRGDRPPERDA